MDICSGSTANGGHLHLKNLVFEGCPRAAISATGLSSTIFQRVLFKGNSNTGQVGGAVYLSEITQVKIHQCSFVGNMAAHAGALFARSSGSAVLQQCSFIRNAAEGEITLEEDLDPELSAGWADVAPRFGGAVVMVLVDEVAVTDTTFQYNQVNKLSC
jgi:hypothetical protein